MVLKALNIPFELVNVNFNAGEHLTDEYFKVIFGQSQRILFSIDTFFGSRAKCWRFTKELQIKNKNCC